MVVSGWAAWPVMAANHRDISVFVQAGHLFVDTGRLLGPLKVTDRVGYDGQFYYRMAVAPFSFAAQAGGVHFDAPAYRSQRFLFPLLAWLLSLGRPAMAPAALVAVNLMGIGVIGFASLPLTRALRISPWAAVAIVLWPGFFVALTHDTSEIVAQAFLVTALLCYATGRLPGYALLAMAATLTRETTALVFGGILVHDLLVAIRGGPKRAAVLGLACLLPIVAWHEALPVLWRESGHEGVLAHDFGWPLLGAARVLVERMSAISAARSLRLAVPAIINAVGTLAMLGFCAAVASRVPACLRRGGEHAALAIAWVSVAALMSLLTAGDGPWTTPGEYCRAFSECWVVGCLVLCAGQPGWIGRRGWSSLAIFSGGFWMLVMQFERWGFGLHFRLL